MGSIRGKKMVFAATNAHISPPIFLCTHALPCTLCINVCCIALQSQWAKDAHFSEPIVCKQSLEIAYRLVWIDSHSNTNTNIQWTKNLLSIEITWIARIIYLSSGISSLMHLFRFHFLFQNYSFGLDRFSMCRVIKRRKNGWSLLAANIYRIFHPLRIWIVKYIQTVGSVWFGLGMFLIFTCALDAELSLKSSIGPSQSIAKIMI